MYTAADTHIPSVQHFTLIWILLETATSGMQQEHKTKVAQTIQKQYMTSTLLKFLSGSLMATAK